jgi:hypothetical protein
MQLKTHNAPYFIVQLKIPPVYQAVIWNGQFEALQGIGKRYKVSGFIAIDSTLEITNPPAWKLHKVKPGDVLVFFGTDDNMELKEICSAESFVQKYNAFPTGSLNAEGGIEMNF